ncbi:hypothetical protein BaRGS_00026466 [Batillaria attramentaria]|uniref:G protein gamma domain-containing protein n=1 Tax=Batillaria attramentaria TaxID=370345 RepID=A0ABD0K638_9CAEN
MNAADPRSRRLQEAIARQRDAILQLKIEANIRRMPLSITLSELASFIEAHSNEDHLLKGFPKPADNPFKEKGGCCIV